MPERLYRGLGMDQSTYPRVAAASLLVGVVLLELLGFALLEIVNYPDARGDFTPMNVSANLAVLFAVLPVVLLLALLRGHEAGAGIAAIVIGGILFMLTWRTQEPKYFVPPLLVFFGGLLALGAYALKMRVKPPVPGQTNQS